MGCPRVEKSLLQRRYGTWLGGHIAHYIVHMYDIDKYVGPGVEGGTRY